MTTLYKNAQFVPIMSIGIQNNPGKLCEFDNTMIYLPQREIVYSLGKLTMSLAQDMHFIPALSFEYGDSNLSAPISYAFPIFNIRIN